jgi:bacterioferritin-associated ferredoxin
MVRQVELSSLDLRYESHRLKNPGFEKVLLASILQYGLKEPLQGIDTENCPILLDGFKRYRCAKKLSISIVPYQGLCEDEALGLIKLIRMSTAKGLTILEQAKLIDELTSVHKMSYSEIAGHVEKSKTWVAMRAGLIVQMSGFVMEKIFSGQFPAYSFMYTLRPFIRMNGVTKQDIEQFVQSVSGKGLSIRDIGLLAHGYFKGCDDLRDQILFGDITWSLKQLKESSGAGDGCTGCTESEKKLLKELEITQRYMLRVIYRSSHSRIASSHFHSQAQIVTSGILRQLEKFKGVIEGLHIT